MNILSQIVLLVILSMSWSNTQNPNDTCTYESNDMKYQIDITISNECTNISAAVAFLVDRINTNYDISSTNCSLCINNLKSDCNMLLTSSDLFISNNPQSSLLISTVTTSPLSNWLSTTTIITNSTSNCLSHDSCHVAVYSLLGVIIIISFSLNIVVLCAFLLKRNRTNKKSSDILDIDNQQPETDMSEDFPTYSVVIKKPKLSIHNIPPPLPPIMDNDEDDGEGHTNATTDPLYQELPGEHEANVFTNKRGASLYESPLSLADSINNQKKNELSSKIENVLYCEI